MRPLHTRSFRQQSDFLRRQFLQAGGLPFTDLLTEEAIGEALDSVGGWLDRVFSPLVTLWVFLGQVLSADHSCRAAVARLIAHRVARGQEPCSAHTGAYCQARKRLPERFFSVAALRTGRALDARVEGRWLWKGRRVYVYDGSSVTMPDTPENQAAYPQPVAQRPGLGFPLARIAAVFSLAGGAVVGLGICRYAGKGQSELGMLRRMLDLFRPGDVVLADRLMCAWIEMAMLKQRGVDSVCRLSSHRGFDFRRGRRLGRGDHVVEWARPVSSRTIDRESLAALPESLAVRECRVTVERPGFRVKTLIIATTLLDAGEYPKEELASLYRAVECGTRFEVAQADAPNGHLAVQDAGAGAQRVVDPHPGLQPDPGGDGAGGREARGRAPLDQLQGGGAGAGGVRAGDRPAGRGRRGVPGGDLRAATGRGGRPPGGGPAGPVRAPEAEAAAQAVRPAHEAQARDQT